MSTYVIGSSGFIGSALLAKMKAASLPVFSVGRTNADIHLDLETGNTDLFEHVQAGDTVVFLAAVSAPDVCKNRREYAENINVKVTSELIDKLTGKNVRVIFSSTDIVFGKALAQVTDNTSLQPFGEYGEMKAQVEARFVNNENVKVIRFSYVMGPNDKYTTMLSECAEKQESVSVFDGFERNVVALSDVTEGIIRLVEGWQNFAEKQINFSGPECVARWELTKAYAEKFSPELKLSLVEAPAGFWDARPKRIAMNSDLFSTLLGREAKSIEQNLRMWCN